MFTVLNIGIKDDLTPETDKSLVIELYDAAGGSRLGPNSQMTIIILANDNVAGILSFQTLSFIVQEGKNDYCLLRVSRNPVAETRDISSICDFLVDIYEVNL